MLDGVSSTLYFSCCDILTWRIPVTFQFLSFVRVCVSVDLMARNITAVYNGEVHNDVLPYKRPLTDSETNAEVQGGGYLIIGIDQDGYGDFFNEKQTMCAEVYDLKFFNALLSVQQMKDYQQCQPVKTLAKAVVDFSDLRNYRIGETIRISSVTREEVCSSKTPLMKVVMPEKRNFLNSVNLCSSMGGKMILPTSKNQTIRLIDVAEQYKDICSGEFTDIVWLPVQGDTDTQTWRHYDTGEVLNYMGFTMEYNYMTKNVRCASLGNLPPTIPYWYARWFPKDCVNSKLCTLCSVESTTMFNLRGLCGSAIFDEQYIISGTVNRKPAFLGTYFSQIIWSPTVNESVTNGSWTLLIDTDPNASGQMIATVLEYPIGRHKWKLQNSQCGFQQSILSFSSCGSEEFTCDDGSCIPITKRCDLESQCSDHSDEIECQVTIPPASYRSTLPPPGNQTGLPLSISLAVSIEFIKKLDVMSFILEQDLRLSVQWYDTRLLFRQLRAASALNIVELSDVWRPQLEVRGHGASSADVPRMSTNIVVHRRTEPLPDDKASIREDRIYEGSYNPLEMTKQMTVSSACHMELHLYPFDNQECHIQFLISKFRATNVKVSNSSISFHGKRILLEYKMDEISIENIEVDGRSGIQINMTFSNLNGFFISNTYVPTLLLLIISYTSFHFHIDEFSDRVMVSLTSLLVLAALFSQTSGIMPKTSYLKLIDVWFVFCIALDFTMVLLLVYINYLTRNQDQLGIWKVYPKPISQLDNNSGELRKPQDKPQPKQKASKINRITVFCVPLTIVLFIICYLGALYHMQ